MERGNIQKQKKNLFKKINFSSHLFFKYGPYCKLMIFGWSLTSFSFFIWREKKQFLKIQHQLKANCDGMFLMWFFAKCMFLC